MPRFDVSLAGEVNLDLILYGLPRQMECERELLAENCCLTLGSSSAILAHNLAVLGAKVAFITMFGCDSLGAIAMDRLIDAGVDTTRSRQSRSHNTGITVLLPHAGARHILTYPGVMFDMSIADLDLDYLASARHFHMSSLFLHRALATEIPGIFREMKRRGLTTSLDTNDDPSGSWAGPLQDTLPYVDVLLPNEREACRIAHTDDLEDALGALAKKVPVVAVKRGSKGAWAFCGKERYSVEAVPVHVVDTIGAGDSFNAGFLFQYVRGESLKSCIEFANLAGAFSTLRSGGTEAFRDRTLFSDFARPKAKAA